MQGNTPIRHPDSSGPNKAPANPGHRTTRSGLSRGLGTRQQLEQATRRRLYEHLLLLPGDHFRSIARSLRVGVGTARHHLQVLMRDGLVYERKTDGRSRYYVAGDPEQLAKNELFGKHWGFRDLRLRIWNALNRSGESTATRIASVLGITRQLAAYHLGRLEEKGLVSSQDRRYRATRSSATAERIDETERNS